MPSPESYSEVMVEMTDCIHRRLCLRLHDEDQAESLALDIMEDFRARFGGELIYFRKAHATERAKRNEAILAAFDGKNCKALARRYGLAEATVYDIIAREQGRSSPRSG
jgi:Mor family transcriptional regulator